MLSYNHKKKKKWSKAPRFILLGKKVIKSLEVGVTPGVPVGTHRGTRSRKRKHVERQDINKKKEDRGGSGARQPIN